MEPVSSTRNARVRSAASLARRRRRRETGRHLVEGPHAVAEALRAGVVETLFLVGDPHGPQGPAVPADVEVVPVTEPVLAHLADTTTPQGLVAVARDVTVTLDALPATGPVVVLDRVADPGNVGGIVRTADAAGLAGVVCLAGTADPLGPKAVRSAAGSTYHLPVAVDVTVPALLAALRARPRRLVGLDGRAQRSVFDLEGDGDPRPVALALGSEAHGLAPELARDLDVAAAVPLWGGAESLNVAVAAGVAIYATAVAERRRADRDRPARNPRGDRARSD